MNLLLSEFNFIPEEYDKFKQIFDKVIHLRKYDKQNYPFTV